MVEMIREYRVAVEGYEAVVQEAGTGAPTIVLLASMFVRARTYRPLLEVLAKTHRTIVVEAPGSGLASRVERPWDFERYAAWLGSFLATLDLRDVTLIGHSNSGPPVFLAAIHHAERIGRIVLADTTGADPRHSFLRVTLGRLADAPLEPIFTIRVAPDVAFGILNHWKHVVHEIRLAYETDLIALAPQVAVPALMAWGRWDLTYPLRFARRLLEQMPAGTRLHVCRTGSHDWLVARRKEFAEVVNGFVRDAIMTQPPSQASTGTEVV